MSSTKILAAGFLSIATMVAATAQAQQLQFKQWRAVGGGNGVPCQYNNPADPAKPNNVQFIQNETGIASFLFDSVGIFLPQNVGGNSSDMSCNVEARVVIPRGYYVSTLNQTIYGGVVKNAGSSGGYSTSMYFFQKNIPLSQINLPIGTEETNIPSFVRSNTQFLADTDAKMCVQCVASTITTLEVDFKFQLLAYGRRTSADQYLMTSIDGADTTVNFAPELKRCPNPLKLITKCSRGFGF